MLQNEAEMWGWHQKNSCKRVINVAGTMTSLGGSITSKEVCEASVAIMGEFVNMHELQTLASATIAELTGAEAGCMTASSCAGITLSVAACITGVNPSRVEALPKNPGQRNEVVVQIGHLCSYGAPVSQAAELAGANVIPIGQSTHVMDFQLESVLTEKTAAALYVASHHVVKSGQIPFQRFVEICKAANVPVIVDAASEYDLSGFIAQGADLVIYSGHKFLGAPTSGIIAGKLELVRAAYLQNIGIGRGMKIGKESIAGAIAALKQWQQRDHVRIRLRERKALDMWMSALVSVHGIEAVIVADPTGNPLERLQLNIDATKFGVDAATVVDVLCNQNPAIIPRSHEADLGYVQLDPCNLKSGQAEIVAQVLSNIDALVENSQASECSVNTIRNSAVNSYLDWLVMPDEN